MEEIKVTYQSWFGTVWFTDFLDMLVSCNPNRRIVIVNSDFLVRHYANGVISYVYKGVHISRALFLVQLSRWMLERKNDADAETAAYSGRAS